MRVKLRTKIIGGGLSIVFFSLLLCTVVISIIVGHQNRIQATRSLARAFTLIDDRLTNLRNRMIHQVNQIALRSELGELVKFYSGSNASQDASTAMEGQLMDLVKTLYEDLKLGGLRKVSIYDQNGTLIAFAKEDKGVATLGFSFISSEGAGYKVVTFKKKKEGNIGLRDFKFTRVLTNIRTKYRGSIPNGPITEFIVLNKVLGFAAKAPIWATDYETVSDDVKEVKRKVGVVVSGKPIDSTILERLSTLTGMKINVFWKDRISQGVVADYKRLKKEAVEALKTNKQYVLRAKFQPLVQDKQLGDEQYIEGLCSLANRDKWMGAVSVLYSKDIFKKNASQMIKALCLVALGCMLLVLPLTFVFSKSVADPIIKVTGALENSSQEVSSASSQVSVASQSLAEGTSKQAASLEQTFSSLEQISAMTKQNADNSKQTYQVTEALKTGLEKANISMKALIKALNEVSQASESVSTVADTISDIAFQTNLLALNASVEAARAGEAGSGFAVVADEVRSLALRAGEASQETQRLLENIREKIDKGVGLVNETDDRYREVALGVQKARGLAEEISHASEEQAEAIRQVTDEVQTMNEIVQQGAAHAEETASASEHMRAQAMRLKEITKEIILSVGEVK